MLNINEGRYISEHVYMCIYNTMNRYEFTLDENEDDQCFIVDVACPRYGIHVYTMMYMYLHHCV